MEAIFPISDLQKNATEVKAAAQEDIVRLTENGRGAYIFASEEAFQARIAEERADAAWEQRLDDGIRAGLADFERGDYYEVETEEDYDAMVRGELLTHRERELLKENRGVA